MNKIKKFFEDFTTFFVNVISKITKKDKWKMFLYLNGQCIKKLYVDEDYKPMEHFYIVKIRGMKHLVGTNRKVQIVFKFLKYKMTDEINKEIHIETEVYYGI